MKRQGELLDSVDHSISIHSLDRVRVRHVLWRLAGYLRQRQPDVILVHMWPLTSAGVLAWKLAGKPGKIFLCEHTSLYDHIERSIKTPKRLVQATLSFSHQSATGVVAVSMGAANDLARLAGLTDQQVEVIHNPIVAAELPAIFPQPDTQLRHKLWGGRFLTHLLTIGSFNAVKNHRLLLQSFAQLAPELDAGLVILGEGGLRATLEQDVEDLGLQGRVVMPGFHADPTPWYNMADLFVLSSDYEGLSNVLIEALACGTPVLSTDCRYGPSEILENGRYGELVPVGNANALAAGILRAARRAWDRQALQRRALDFSIPRQSQAYLDLFNRP